MNKDLLTNIFIIILISVLGILLFNKFPQDEDTELDNKHTFTPSEIVVNFSYERGLHEYSGSIDFPNGCYSLKTTEAIVMESYPEQVVLNFETNPIEEDVMCTQAIQTEDFRILFRASEEATVSAKYNGKNINLLIIQNQILDESIDDLEQVQ